MTDYLEDDLTFQRNSASEHGHVVPGHTAVVAKVCLLHMVDGQTHGALRERNMYGKLKLKVCLHSKVTRTDT